MLRLVLLVLLVPLSLATPARAGSPSSIVEPEFLEQYARTYRFTAGHPASITPAPGGREVLFLRSGPASRVMDLFEFDVATGRERVVLTASEILAGAEESLSAAELARRERMRQIARGISTFELSEDGRRLLVPLSGRLFVVERASRQVRELRSALGYPLDPHLSPDGSKVACVRDGDLFVTDVASGVETRLTTGAGGGKTHGLAEFVAQEEMGRLAGYWWDPDGRSIAYIEVDTSGLETFTIADPLQPEKPAQTWPYPRPGKANARVRLGVVDLSSPGTTRWIDWDRSKYEYLARVCWDKNAPLTLELMNRAQTELAVLAADPASGALSKLVEEADPAWINLPSRVPAWLADGSGFLWVSERSGWPVLSLHAPDGKPIREVAGKADGFVQLAHVDAATGTAHLLVADDPAETHVARVDCRRGAPQRITRGQAVFEFSGGKPLSTYVLARSDLTGPPRFEVHRPDGSAAGLLKSVAEEPRLSLRIELVTAGDRALRAAVLRPRNFERSHKYPVIMSVYGGPHVNVVQASQSPHLLRQWLADQGFVVVLIDGRGTPRRGRDWERAIRNDLIGVALSDQVEGLRALAARFPEMDLRRVGIYGWSFGGYFSAMAAMRRPDVFQAACAGAPVCDWRDYDTCYTERYLGLLGSNAGVYDRSSVLTYCADLTVPLLLVHGTADDNVYFMHSLKIAGALLRAGREFDFLVLPGLTHMVPDPAVTRGLYGRIATFFARHLAP